MTVKTEPHPPGQNKPPGKSGLLAALLEVQKEAPVIPKAGDNPHFRSKFAQLDDVTEKIEPLLSKNGLVWTCKPSYDPQTGEPILKYRMAHVPSGETDEDAMKLFMSKVDPQGQGSGVSYARRYALVAYLNLRTGEDDDGNAASAKPAAQKVAPERADLTEIKTLVRRNKVKTEELRTMLRGAGLTFEPKANPAVLLPQLTPDQAALVTQFLQAPIPEGTSDVPSDASEFEHEKDTGPPLFDPSIPA